jgi:hypothetical protein
MYPIRHFILLAATLGSLWVAAQDADPVVFSFATVGDSRGDAATATNGQDRRWQQSTKPYSRILREIQAQKPNALFFNGDMIMGYSTDPHELDKQYAYWRGMVAGLMETGTYVVPVPGNHEVQHKVKDPETGKTAKLANPISEESWRENMGDLILDSARWAELMGKDATHFDPANTPPVGGPDPIQTSQRQLTFSFDYLDSHFVVIDTDPAGNDQHAPVHWLKQDIDAARARGAHHIFVFGHKPAFTYFFKPVLDPEGFDRYPENQKAFWQVIEDSGATYFCGHEHIFNLSQPAKVKGGHAYQVMVGSGGSPFSAKPGDSQNPEDRTYAWGLVQVHQSGRVHLDIWGFSDSFGETHQLRSLDLASH